MLQADARPQPDDRHLGRYGARHAAELIAAADVAPGQRTLDVGCGLGPLTIELAGLVGEARVTAVDPSHGVGPGSPTRR